MKNYLILTLASLLMATQSEGQSSSKSLFGGKDIQIGLWGGGGFQYGSLDGDGALLGTGRIGILLNPNLAVGGFYAASLGEINPDTETDTDIYYDIQMGGLILEYTLNPDKVLHVSFPLQLGWGELQADWREGSPNYGDDDFFGEERLFVIEPGALLEVNLLPWARLQAGASYRLVASDLEYRGLRGTDLQGISGNIGLRFGMFGSR